MNKDELREYYVNTLSNESFSDKGGGGLGMIDIARKSGQKFEYSFTPINNIYSFFSLIIKITQ